MFTKTTEAKTQTPTLLIEIHYNKSEISLYSESPTFHIRKTQTKLVAAVKARKIKLCWEQRTNTDGGPNNSKQLKRYPERHLKARLMEGKNQTSGWGVKNFQQLHYAK